MPKFSIGNRMIGETEPVYFIADIGANHDGQLKRARQLIRLAKEAGADAAKFQNFRALKIVSKYGFEKLGTRISHQCTWKKSVYQVYEEASIPWEWTEMLKAECDDVDIDYFSTPYDFEAVDMLEPYVDAYKIGSGDITWLEMLRKVSGKGKPVILSTGASNITDVQLAVQTILATNPYLVLMQCNTNYTGSSQNFKHIHLNVLRAYSLLFPDSILGLSDHSPGHAAVLGAIALGARVVEKHLTDNNKREGPDHGFAMTPKTWKEMVDRSREVEQALGTDKKHVAENEKETVIVQRRCLRASRNLPAGTVLKRDMIEVLRPAPLGAIQPCDIDKVLGMRLKVDVPAVQELSWTMLEEAELQ